MKRIKSIIALAGIMLLILSAASLYVSFGSLSEIRPSESYEDKGLRTFKPYDVLPVQVKNTSASSRDRRMNPTKTVYMVYYRATDGSGYQWSDEVPAKSYGEKVVAEGKAVERRVLSIPEAGTYITIEPDQTAESFTDELQNRYYMIIGFSAIYVLFYAVVWGILLVWKRIRRENREWDEFGTRPSRREATMPFSPEISEVKPPRRGKKLLLILLPVALLVVIVIGMSRGGSEAPDMDFGWNGSVWASDVLGLRYTLPATGEKRDAGEVEADRESKFGHRRSAGQTILVAVDPVEGSSLSLIAVIDRPTEKELQKNMEYTVKYLAQDGPYESISLGEETLAGQTWRAWRIELPERGLVHYYLVRQNGAFWLILSTDSPMAETPPAILTGFEGETSFQTSVVNTYLPPANQDGYLVATFPPALLGNETAEELVTSFYEDLASASDMTPEELQAALYWSDITANEDGSVSYYFTPEQYQKTKKMYYAWGTRVINDDFFGFNPSDIVKRLEYTGVDEAGIPRAVTAWVNQEYFQSGVTFSDFVARFVPMTIIGRYQIMCGVPGDEWAVHVTVRNADTGNVTYEGDFSQSPSEPPESGEIR